MKIFNNDLFLTKLPTTWCDKQKTRMMDQLKAMQNSTAANEFKIPDNGQIPCQLCGMRLDFGHDHATQMIANHFFTHFAKCYSIYRYECVCGYKTTLSSGHLAHKVEGSDGKMTVCGGRRIETYKAMPLGKLRELSAKMFGNEHFFADVFSNLNPDWQTNTWTSIDSKNLVLEACLTMGNAYNLPGHYLDLLKCHRMDENLIEMGARIVKELISSAPTRGKHARY